MRIDHHAYQRATRVAGVGLLIQLAIGLTLLIFTLAGGAPGAHDTAFLYAALYVLLGSLAWIGLIVLFNQHKLERLEALELDTLDSSAESVFETEPDELRVAGRRLQLMHKWLMPILSIVIALGLAVLSWRIFAFLHAVKAGEAEFRRTDALGWAVAICIAFSAASFIFSRFVAGMAKQPAWQNLRGGAAFMVGNSLVTLAVAVGIGFRFFKNEEAIVYVVFAMGIVFAGLAGETVLNFILNLYRPRIPGEVPRPAFDSKLLSLFAAPDNLIRSINEQVNYQFGFDVTSSWGYQLLLRSVAWLGGLAILVLVLLNMIVIVEPNEQGVKLAGGGIVGDVHDSGVMLKLPWPLQTAETFPVTTVRELYLTSKEVEDPRHPNALDTQLWTDNLGHKLDKELDPFIVRSARVTGTGAGEGAAERVAQTIALLDAELIVQYRIRETNNGLLDYLNFSDAVPRRTGDPMRQQALRAIALREVSQELARLSIDEVLGSERAGLADRLKTRVQTAYDAQNTGVEVVAVALPLMRPAGEASAVFEEYSISHQARQKLVSVAERSVIAGLANLVGDPRKSEEILAAVTTWARLRDEDPAAAAEQRIEVERMIREAGGLAAQLIERAEFERQVRLLRLRAEVLRMAAQIEAYRADPELYRRRETMIVYGTAMANLQKYLLCVDPEQVEFDLDLRELSSMFNISDVLEDEGATP